MFVSRDRTVEAVRVPGSQLSRVASDHLPLIVDLHLAQSVPRPGSVSDSRQHGR